MVVYRRRIARNSRADCQAGIHMIRVWVGAMPSTPAVTVRNWDRTLTGTARVVARPRTVQDVVAVMTDRDRYPSPVRPVGSDLSTTRCNDTDGGTLLDMRGMNGVIEVSADTVRVAAWALYYDVAHTLLVQGLHFHVHIEMGNPGMGSAACGGTEDSSLPRARPH